MRKLAIPLLFLCLGLTAGAQNRYFAQTYITTVLEKSEREMELWHTSRFGHEEQYYHAMDQRLELELGLGGRVQTSVYFNRYQTMVSNSSNVMTSTSGMGISSAWKWQVTPEEHPFGAGLFGEATLGGNKLDLQARIILDKKFGKNRVAFNLAVELDEQMERENSENNFRTETVPLELDLAWMHHFGLLGMGLEFRNNNMVSEGRWQHSVLYAGPTVYYGSHHWFVLANYLPQLGNLHHSETAPGKMVLDAHERHEARLILGFSF